ncbi:MAG: endolytic transglycosylase MltG [Candidatus Levybacteria bacterium]|nr:endolytic transglycosylase MltG [Candidatus Levybacteria bacterium]
MKKLSILLALIVIIGTALFLWWKNGISPVNPKNNTPQIFVIAKGEGMREIANSLKKNGLIKDPIVFFLLTKKTGYDKRIQAGDFRLNPSMSMYSIIEALTHGTLDIWVTIPEGLRALEISDIFKKELPTYKPEWEETLVVNEGYLFPDTYLIPKDANIDVVLSLMKGNFDRKYETIETNKSNFNQNEIVTIASMIEREARYQNDRPLVASVIANRLEIGMKLDIDATVQYALGSVENKNRWKKNLTFEDLRINSPYNTYRNAGLPPTPISNPGLEVLKAAANPARTNYLYYISDKDGRLHFAETLEEQNQNIKRYGL